MINPISIKAMIDELSSIKVGSILVKNSSKRVQQILSNKKEKDSCGGLSKSK